MLEVGFDFDETIERRTSSKEGRAGCTLCFFFLPFGRKNERTTRNVREREMPRCQSDACLERLLFSSFFVTFYGLRFKSKGYWGEDFFHYFPGSVTGLGLAIWLSFLTCGERKSSIDQGSKAALSVTESQAVAP